MDYKKHTKDRFKERFGQNMSDTEYFELTEIARLNPNKVKVSNKASKVIVNFKGNDITCILSYKKKIVKTVYPAEVN